MQFHDFVFGHIEIEVNGRAYDLHNFYQARTITYDIVDRTALLVFTRWPEAWVPDEEASKIIISFHEVSYFSATEQDHESVEGDSRVIHSIGVVDPDADTQNFYLTDKIQPNHHLVICFESGLTLRVQASEARSEIIF